MPRLSYVFLLGVGGVGGEDRLQILIINDTFE